MLAPWPAVEPAYRDAEVEETFALLQDIIRAVRNIRSKLGVAERKPLEVVTSVPDERAAERLRRHERILKQLGYIERIEIGVGLEKPAGSATDVVGQIQVFVPLKGVLDIDEERDRLQKKIEQKENYVAGLLRKLSEPNFLERAPAQVVAREKARCKEIEEEVAKLRASLAELERVNGNARTRTSNARVNAASYPLALGIRRWPLSFRAVSPWYSIPSRLMSSLGACFPNDITSLHHAVEHRLDGQAGESWSARAAGGRRRTVRLPRCDVRSRRRSSGRCGRRA